MYGIFWPRNSATFMNLRKLGRYFLGLLIFTPSYAESNFIDRIKDSKYLSKLEIKLKTNEEYFVHLKQIHFNSLLVVLNDKELVNEIRKHQKNIYNLVSNKIYNNEIKNKQSIFENIKPIYVDDVEFKNMFVNKEISFKN